MRIEMAPMEGITNYIYRQTFSSYFSGVTTFYTPFLTPNQNLTFNTRERNEISPENNRGLSVIPQVLVRNPEHFLWACRELADLGYTQVNLNLGCPSGTVVAKKKGSGFLSVPYELDEFFDRAFSATANLPLAISVKTRIGVNDPEEFPFLMEIFNDYPIHHLILHPRLRKDFYSGPLHMELFDYALTHSKIPLSYNGDLFSSAAIRSFVQAHPQLHSVMLGRGLISNPALAMEALGTGSRDAATLRAFHDELLARNQAVLSGDRSLLSRMKELWTYQLPLFTHGQDYLKPLRKTQHLPQYLALIDRLFAEETLTEGSFSPP